MSHAHYGNGHTHGAAGRAGARHEKRLVAAFVVIFAFFVVEVVAGFATNSLALLSDAGHMLTDVIGIGMALAAIQLADRFRERSAQASSPHTFGLYRLEILAAFLNALLLFGVAIWVLIEAGRRLTGDVEVESGWMLAVAFVGLLANLVAFWLLRPGAAESVNVEGAYLEVVADTLGSIGVIVAAVTIQLTGWTWVDPAMAALVGVWILPRTWRLGRNAVRILLQAAPAHVDPAHLDDALRGLDGVVDVHDLHVWTLTSDMHAASAHLVTEDDEDMHAVLDRARELLTVDYAIDHGTFQVEPRSHEGCEHVDW